MLTKNADLWRTTLDWPTPDDLDLEVYRKGPDGELTEVGSSGNLPGQKEMVESPNADGRDLRAAGDQLRLGDAGYTLTTALFDARTRWTRRQARGLHPDLREERKVLQTARVFVDRGDQEQIDLTKCRRKW